MKETFDITDHKVLKGRESYSHLFDRKERRDLAHNIIILQESADNLTLSFGITDENGVFSDTVEQLDLASKTPSEDAARIRTQIDTILTESSNGTLLRQRSNDFKTHVADAGLKAENTRNEILQHVEEIRNISDNLHDASQEISGQLNSLLQTTNTHLQQLIGKVNPSFYLPASSRS